MPPLRCSKMPELLCIRLPMPEASMLQHSSPHRLIYIALQGGEAACQLHAAAARLLLAHKANWGIHTLQCLLWSGSQLGSVVHIGRVPDLSVCCPWAFLSLSRKPVGNTAINLLSDLGQILR